MSSVFCIELYIVPNLNLALLQIAIAETKAKFQKLIRRLKTERKEAIVKNWNIGKQRTTILGLGLTFPTSMDVRLW